jgi:hypothetical protein
MVERNGEWAALLRAELKSVWDGYIPNPALVTRNDGQGDEPLYNADSLDELQRRRDALRAAAAALGATADADEAVALATAAVSGLGAGWPVVG